MAVAGKQGAFRIGAAVAVSSIDGWKLDISADMKEITTLDSNGWKEYLATLKGWTGSLSGQYNIATDTAGQKALQDAFFSGTPLAVEFNVDGTHKYTGNALISKQPVEVKVDDTIKYTCDLQGTGPLNYA